MALANGIDIQLITQLADDLPEISGDEAELRSALGNLVFNAVDAMPEGGTITLKTFQDGQEVILEVADTGLEISSFGEGPDGEIYVLDFDPAGRGKIYILEPLPSE